MTLDEVKAALATLTDAINALDAAPAPTPVVEDEDVELIAVTKSGVQKKFTLAPEEVA